jgi:hypothetical protein
MSLLELQRQLFQKRHNAENPPHRIMAQLAGLALLADEERESHA